MSKYSLYPIKNQEVFQYYKTAQSFYWTSEEVDFADDRDSIAKMTDNEMFFVKQILAFFATSDGIVNENLNTNFINEFDEMEVKCFYGFQVMMENIHSETYSLLIEVYEANILEREKLLNAVETIPCIKRKADFCKKYMDTSLPLFIRLIAFAVVEGVFFSGCFCAIFWLKGKGIRGGLTFSNELISRDEKLHTDFACLLYRQGKDKLSPRDIHTIIKEGVEIEEEFINHSLPCSLLGMNADMMTEYIKYVADGLLTSLDCIKCYNIPNPFPFMDHLKMEGKTNFFESRVSEYQSANVDKGDDNVFSLDAYF